MQMSGSLALSLSRVSHVQGLAHLPTGFCLVLFCFTKYRLKQTQNCCQGVQQLPHHHPLHTHKPAPASSGTQSLFPWLSALGGSCLTGPLTLRACHLCVGCLLFLDSPSGRPPVSIFLHSGHCVAAVGNIGVLWKGTGDKNKLHLLPLAYQLYRVSATNRSHRPQTHKGSSARPDTKGSTVTQQSKRQETKESPMTQNPRG